MNTKSIAFISEQQSMQWIH